jgi:hypothetical protein
MRKVLHSTLFTVRALVYGIRCYLIEEGMVSDIIPVCDVSVDFQFCNVFCCSFLIMVQGEFSGVLIMDDLKSKTKYNHREWTVIRYIFDVMYETKRV